MRFAKYVFKIQLRSIVAGIATLSMLSAQTVYAADATGATASGATASGDASSAATAAAISSDGYSEDAAKLKAETKAILAFAEKIQTAGGKVLVMEVLKKIDSFASYYANLHGTCTTSQASAKFVCREETSPKLQDTLNQVNTLMGAVTASGVTDACSTFGKIMTMAQAGLTAYTAACSAARAACESSCSTVYSNIKNINDLSKSLMNAADVCVGGYPPEATTPAAQTAAIQSTASMCVQFSNELHTTFKTNVVLVAEKENNYNDANPSKSMISKNKACTYTYASMIISAGTGILGVIQSAKAANECEDETDGTSTSTTTSTTDTCSVAANANLPECICAANPRLAGCANALEKAGDAATTTVSALSSPNAASSTASGLTSADLASDGTMATTSGTSSDSSGSSAAGAPVGGASSLSSGGGNSSGTGTGTEGNTKSALNANILGGGASGGGGGGWGSRSTASDESKYRSYLPGGDKDPNKVAGQSNWTKEVTSQAGKSNWEKIRERYRDNTNTLIGN
ncbi:hypothetical protein [Bdellovibrio sp. NC01]|uniref:hypothetical protein n=1 Tax=Bdellovibrio sp. NC01 TaxID=2220073 RepID=UPI001158BB05|nr:hypothetical protein [Bdellovibrio sp. NC01]